MSVLDYSVAVVSVDTAEILTASAAREQSRILDQAEDGFLNDCIVAGRILFERDSRRLLIEHTYDFKFENFPGRRIQFEGHSPLKSITHLKYIDTGGTLQTWASSNYEVDTARDAVWRAYNVEWPATRDVQNAVQIRAVFGHAATDDEVRLAKRGILMLAGHWYEQRETVVIGTISKQVEFGYNAIVESIAKRSYP